jgi:heterodisulfide reductase subunit A-like polyferredoxin
MTTPRYAFDNARSLGESLEQSKNKISHLLRVPLAGGGTTGIVAALAESGLETVAFRA